MVGFKDGSGEKYIRQNKPLSKSKSIAVVRWGCGCCEDHSPLTEEEIANVKLLAAAPDLLEACRLMVDFFPEGWEVPYGWNQVMAQVKVAMRKAA